MNTQSRSKIAIIGAGVAGIAAAEYLQNDFDICLFEKEVRLGGHTHTYVLNAGDDQGLGVDTGFIVFNARNYPQFCKLLEKWNIDSRATDMSFGYWDEISGLQYAGTNLNGIFAQRSNLLSKSFWRLIKDVYRFGNSAAADLAAGRLRGISMGEYFSQLNMSRDFIESYFVPMSAAIWSSKEVEILNSPAEMFCQFFKNHGLLTLRDRPRWRTVSGGSHTYLQAFKKTFTGRIENQTEIKSIRAVKDGVCIISQKGTQTFDRVIVATHADEAFKVLDHSYAAEKKMLSPFAYAINQTVLHTYQQSMPPNKRAWAAWNYFRNIQSSNDSPVSITYWMNRLQGLRSQNDYFVTLNDVERIPKSYWIAEFNYAHPQFTPATSIAQEQLKNYNQNKDSRIYFCGSYLGFGFHEDAVRSSYRVAQTLGALL